jgi:hypothetical protein
VLERAIIATVSKFFSPFTLQTYSDSDVCGPQGIGSIVMTVNTWGPFQRATTSIDINKLRVPIAEHLEVYVGMSQVMLVSAANWELTGSIVLN